MSALLKKYTIAIDNGNLSDKELQGFLNLSLSQSIQSHHTLTLNFRQDVFDKESSLFSKSKEFLGKSIDLMIEVDQTGKKLNFSGVITSLNTSRYGSYDGSQLVIKAYSPDIVLNDGSICKSFSDKTLEDVAREVVKDHNLTCKFEPQVQFETGSKSWLVQYKESAYEFLNRLAAKYGQWFFYDGEKLVFGKLNHSLTEELILGKTLFGFNVSLKTEPFTFGLITYDWNDDGSQVFESKEKNNNLLGKLSPLAGASYDASQKLFPNDTQILYNHPLTAGNQQNHLDDRIKIKKTGKAAGMVIVDGETDTPSLKIGDRIKVVTYKEKTRYEQGDYTIISIQHSAQQAGRYTNHFTAIPAECVMPFTASPHSFPFCETQSARVAENNDPDNMGRIRVKFFWQNDELSPWIRIINPYSGQDMGHFFIPEIDDEVLVAFEAGNAEKPFVLGSMYHAKAKPESFKSEQNDIKAIRTRSGHTIELDDTDGKEEIRIYDYNKNNYTLTFRTHSKEIILEAVENIELKAKNITLKAEKDLKIEATDITEKTSGNIDTTANGNITVKSTGNFTQEASSNMTVKGSVNTTVEAGVNATIKAGAILEENASMIKIN